MSHKINCKAVADTIIDLCRVKIAKERDSFAMVVGASPRLCVKGEMYVHTKKEKAIFPRVAIVTVGSDPASEIYVNGKIKDFAKIGVETMWVKMSGDLEHVQTTMQELNDSDMIHGIILQLPLPRELAKYTDHLLNLISPSKDIDCLTRENIGKLYSGESSFAPATATAVELLACVGPNQSADQMLGSIMEQARALVKDDALNYFRNNGEVAVVLGRSNLVGKPVCELLRRHNYTVLSLNSFTHRETAENLCNQAYIIVSATGAPNLITEKHVDASSTGGPSINIEKHVEFSSHRQFVIDVGIHRDGYGHICGDMDKNLYQTAEGEEVPADNIANDFPNLSYTPVPGGVGLLTRAMLMYNFTTLYVKYLDFLKNN